MHVNSTPPVIVRDYLLLEFYYLYALLQLLLGKKDADQPVSALATDLLVANDLARVADQLPNTDSGDQAEIRRIEALRNTLINKFGNNLPLIRLRSRLQYDDFEHMRLVLSLAPRVDPRFEELYRSIAREQSHHPLEPGFAPLLLGCDWTERLELMSKSGPNSPLREYGVLAYDDSARQLKADERLLHFALGQNFDPEILASARVDNGCDTPAKTLDAWLAPLQSWLSDVPKNGLWIHMLDRQIGTLASLAAAKVGQEIVDIDFVRLKDGEDPEAGVDHWLRESLLRGALPVFNLVSDVDHSESRVSTRLMAYLDSKLQRWPFAFVICSDQPQPPPLLESLQLEVRHLRAFAPVDREALWWNLLKDSAAITDCAQTSVPMERRAVGRLANTFDYDLKASLRVAQRVRAQLTNKKRGDPQALLVTECRVEAQRHVSGLGRLVGPRYTFDDIVLPDSTLAQLREFCAMGRLQDKVRDEWGLGEKLIPKPATTALFAGLSGTGKTMAVEIVAGHLGRPLLRVDLAAIVSKYIGETEKNLEKVFKQAEDSCSLLFFDEADALFGRRSEVKEAHDRYANIEISYLLQRMEQYRGVAILASNLRQHLDDAFVRRLTMTVLFPFPSWQQRVEIWRRLMPAAAPVDKRIDWEEIARRYRLSGGNIRNAIVSAAYHAAMNGGVIVRENIVHGIRREVQKMGKQLAVEDAR